MTSSHQPRPRTPRRAASVAALALLALAAPSTASADLFEFTGAEQTYTVPEGVERVLVTAVGGRGGGTGQRTGHQDRGTMHVFLPRAFSAKV